MKITKATSTTAQIIEVEEYGDYIRFSEDCWYRRYGESLESEFYDEAKLEKAYQEYTLASIPK